jgi:putative FmdB family regulatory protein
MPLYEYQCEKCGRFELIKKFSDEPVQTCPTCGGPVQKLLSSPAIQFKGTGWYVTDYAKSGGSKGKSEGGKSEGSKSESKSEGSKDSGSKDSGSKDSGAKSGSGSGEKSGS